MYYKAIILLIFTTIYYYTSAETESLRLTDVHIPRHMDLHQPAVLSCNFDLANGKLYSVKWYKDEFEFFRYMPANNPQILTFPLNGVNLDLSQSNMTVITLNPLSFNSSGSYRCEVSTDAPNFETAAKNGNMTVMVFPKSQPTIDGIKEYYSSGEYIIGNCTSSRSNPPAELSWYINNDKADSWLMERYPLTITEGTLYSSALGLKFQAEESHFATNDKIELRCEAKIADLPPWQNKKSIKFYQNVSNHKPAPDSYRNNNGARKTTVLLWTLLLTLCLTHWPMYSSI
ncbi:uncharacterized protein LOC135835476 [Planococcus citri]|uniref:uncharacterized protein LOC135835476 n=1 Tax=Planococcus citri TaxID=170843 RepID=UPI0031F84D2B